MKHKTPHYVKERLATLEACLRNTIHSLKAGKLISWEREAITKRVANLRAQATLLLEQADLEEARLTTNALDYGHLSIEKMKLETKLSLLKMAQSEEQFRAIESSINSSFSAMDMKALEAMSSSMSSSADTSDDTPSDETMPT